MSARWAKAALCSGVSLSALRYDELIRAKQLCEAKDLIREGLDAGLSEQQVQEVVRASLIKEGKS